MSSSTPSNKNNYHTDENILYTSLNDTLVEEKKYLRAKAVTFISIAKVIYFCVGINGACARSFLAIFLKDADLSYTSIGIYFAVNIKYFPNVLVKTLLKLAEIYARRRGYLAQAAY